MKARFLVAGFLAGSLIGAATCADAAVTVLGNGPAHTCFEYAEFGGSPDEGIADCTTAIEQTAMPVKDLAATYINRGILRARAEDPHGALADYDKGLSIDPNLGEGYVNRGATMIVLKQYDEAIRDIDRGIALGPNRVQIAWYDRGIAQEAQGDIRGAYEDYRKAVEIQPDFTLAIQQLSRFRVVHKPADGT